MEAAVEVEAVVAAGVVLLSAPVEAYSLEAK